MVRQLTPTERALWNVEQPDARVTCDLQAENGPWSNLRQSHVRRLALRAQGLAAFHTLRDNVAALQTELDRILEEAHS